MLTSFDSTVSNTCCMTSLVPSRPRFFFACKKKKRFPVSEKRLGRLGTRLLYDSTPSASASSLYYDLCAQRLREAMQYESQVKQDKHIFSFALYELAMIHISREEVGRSAVLLS